MGIRRKVIAYSRGNDLGFFWEFYRWQKKVKKGFLFDILTFFMSRSAHNHGGYVGVDARLGENISLPHGLHGIFISRYAFVGDNCLIYQNVTIGQAGGLCAPQIGDGCLIGAGAVIVGDIRIGNHVKIGAGAVVSRDVPDYCTVVSQPPRIIVPGLRGQQKVI